MIIDTKEFFKLVNIHHRLPPASRPNDLAGRLTSMANPDNNQFRVTPTTRRCLALFLARRIQPSSSNQGVA